MKKSVLTREGLIQLWSSFNSLFVRKETGKGLSSNDFTNTYKNMIDESYPEIEGLKYNVEVYTNLFDETVGTRLNSIQYSVPILEENDIMINFSDNLRDGLSKSTEELSTIILDLHSRIKALEDKS